MTDRLTAEVKVADGRTDFDFLFGRWRIQNRKLRDPLAVHGSEWDEFESTSECRPILGGVGNVETYSTIEFPTRGAFEGATLRLFAPATGDWRIWWASTHGGGELYTPVVGCFADGSGRFECEDVLGGRTVRVRYDWKDITEKSACWEQSFSFDEGENWEPNWTMNLTRLA